MAGGRDNSLQSISVQLDGENYSYWSYVMKNFLKGKKMWGYVTGTFVRPTNQMATDYAAKLDAWEANNATIITWINNSVVHLIGSQLAKYETAKEVWEHLARLFTQSNFAKQYQLEIDIRALQQKNMTIQEFYSAMTDLWDKLALTESTELQELAPYIARREEQRLVQFLMALRDDFEGSRESILYRSPLPSLDAVVSELLAEEIRLKSQAGKGIASPSNPSVFATPQRPPPSNQNKSNSKVAHDKCGFRKQKGHWKAQCPTLLNRAKRQQQQSHQQQQRPRQQQQHPRQQQQQQSHQQQHHPRQQQQQQQQSSPLSSHVNGSLTNQSSQWTHKPPPPHSTVATPSLDPFMFEQFQKFIGTQPHAMSASSPVGPAISGVEWDRP